MNFYDRPMSSLSWFMVGFCLIFALFVQGCGVRLPVVRIQEVPTISGFFYNYKVMNGLGKQVQFTYKGQLYTLDPGAHANIRIPMHGRRQEIVLPMMVYDGPDMVGTKGVKIWIPKLFSNASAKEGFTHITSFIKFR